MSQWLLIKQHSDITEQMKFSTSQNCLINFTFNLRFMKKRIPGLWLVGTHRSHPLIDWNILKKYLSCSITNNISLNTMCYELLNCKVCFIPHHAFSALQVEFFLFTANFLQEPSSLYEHVLETLAKSQFLSINHWV